MRSELVSEYDRIVYRPGVVCGPLMQIAAADADVGDLQQHIVRAYLRCWDIADFNRASRRREIHNGSIHVWVRK